MLDLKRFIREVPDWPKKGVNFKDITPLLKDGAAFGQAIDEMAAPWSGKKIDLIVGIDARGFILTAALAYKLGVGLAIARKKGKLPWKTIAREYQLEYGSNIIEMHKDAVESGQKVLIIDDVLATGGTMAATCEMVEKLGGEIIGIGFLIGLSALGGEKKLGAYKIDVLLTFSYKSEHARDRR